MYKTIVAVLSAVLFLPTISIAQNEVSENLFKQLKANIEKTCENEDYLKCINTTADVCNNITQTELEKISQILETQAQAIADGKLSALLLEIKTARSMVLEENNIDIDTANACGKEHLIK